MAARLIVIAYEGEAQAKEGVQAAVALEREGLIRLKSAAVVRRRDDGRIAFTETADVSDRAATAGGAFWGGLLGTLFGGPVVGAGVGAAVGRLSARRSDLGISDDFQRQVGAKLEPGRAAAVLLGEAKEPGVALREAYRLGGEVLETDLDPLVEEELRRAIAERDESPA